jgi:glycosyltransferase involved in cell wall biosynthesis
MRLLYASHTYLVNENQKKLTAIAALPGVSQLACLTPHLWREPVLGSVYPHQDAQANFQLLPTRILLTGNEMRFVYLSLDCHLRQQQPDVIVAENGPGAFSYSQLLLARNRFAPKAKAVFFTWWNIPYRPRQPLRALEAWNMRQSAGAIAGNQAAADILRQNGFGGDILVLPQLGIDEQAFAPNPLARAKVRANLGIAPDDPRPIIGYAGRLVPEKGLQVLLDALQGWQSGFHLLVIGNGPLKEKLAHWGANLPTGQMLHLQASVPHSQIAEWMNALDIFVLPSLSTPVWLEQFGHVLIEAMSCEVAVVGSSSAEIPNVIGSAGRVVPEGDALALRQALSHLCENPAERKALAQAGRQRVLDTYTHLQIARQTLAFLQSV